MRIHMKTLASLLISTVEFQAEVMLTLNKL